MAQRGMTVSVVVPVLNDAAALRELLQSLKPAPLEVIVADGGSRDGSAAVAEEFGAAVVQSPRSRGGQLDDGVREAKGELVWMLHADARPAAVNIEEVIGLRMASPVWGRFDVHLDDSPPLRVVAAAMNLRSAVTGICTGDQGIFVHRHLLWAIGGVPRQPLMEDVELSKRLRRLIRPQRAATLLAASPRRWRSQGALSTVAAMWRLRLRYALGETPEALYRSYYGEPS